MTSSAEILAEVKVLLANDDFSNASKVIQRGLELYPGQWSFLISATDVFRACRDREKSLHCSELLMRGYPEKLPGYVRTVQDLVFLKRFEAARSCLGEGEKRFPNNLKLLVAGTEVFRGLGDRKKALEYSERLISFYPESPSGYIRAGQDLFAMKYFRRSRKKVRLGLKAVPDNIRLQILNLDATVALNEFEGRRECTALICRNSENVSRKDVLFLLRHLIKELRNRRFIDLNWPALNALLSAHFRFILRHSDLKWLKSICDTLVDHDDTERRLLALSVTTFINTLRVAEMVRMGGDRATQDFREIGYCEIYDGLYTFSVSRQDALLNLSRRMKWSLRSDWMMSELWEEVLMRIHSSKNVIKEFSEVSEYPCRYMPIDPTGIKDSYGLCYEDIYSQ